MFDIPPSERSVEAWSVNLPLDERDWNVGLIVGPSGCGKTTIARELFAGQLVAGFEWSDDAAVVDDFPHEMSVRDVTLLLSRVGFSSPPAWLRPFRVLSNGEQFRVTIARALAETRGPIVVDEFTSVVDRTVAQVGSHAVAKTIREQGRQFIAVTCHYDVVDWLQPDWTYEPAVGHFTWRDLQRRPPIDLAVFRVRHSAWQVFSRHHYLTRSLPVSAACYVAMYRDQPAAFVGVLPFPHAHVPGWRIARVVCLPDFQGVGIGNALFDYVAALYRATGKHVSATMAHPALIYRLAKSREWRMMRAPTHTPTGGQYNIKGLLKTGAWNRLTAGFRYVGPPRFDDAVGFGIITAPFAARGREAWERARVAS